MSEDILVMGESMLYQSAEAVEDVNDPEIARNIEQLIAKKIEMQGLGIAAPQLGINKRIIIIGFEESKRYPGEAAMPMTALINPEYEAVSDEKEYGWEGCLSVPGMRGLVNRYQHIIYRAIDEQGRSIEKKASGFHARVIQHEVDHINGVLFPMRVENPQDFGYESVLWERITGQSYEDYLQQQQL